MASKRVFQRFTGPVSGSWVCPAGVTQVRISTKRSITQQGLGAASVSARTTYAGVFGWGANTNGELGTGSAASVSVPTQVNTWYGGRTLPKQILNSQGNTFYVLQDGTAYGTGANSGASLGIGTTGAVSAPTLIVGDLNFEQIISNDGLNTFGLTPGGQLYSWGTNANGELGIGNVTAQSFPQAVLGGLTFSQVVACSASIFGLATTGQLYAWGGNAQGQLGLGDTVSRSSPVAVLGGLTFTQVFAPPLTGQFTTFGMIANGQIYGWGQGSLGQFGNGGSTNTSSPILAAGGASFATLVPGNFKTVYAIDNNGVGYAWGGNSSGSLGANIGTGTLGISTPTLIAGGQTWANIQGNYQFALGLNTSGQIYGWGANTAGQLGIGTSTPVSSPNLVTGGNTWTQLFSPPVNLVTSGPTFANDINGYLWAWGLGTSGQIGNGAALSVSSPVLVMANMKIDNYVAPDQHFLTVVPGTTYAVLFGYQTTFGPLTVGINCPNVTIDYFL